MEMARCMLRAGQADRSEEVVDFLAAFVQELKRTIRRGSDKQNLRPQTC